MWSCFSRIGQELHSNYRPSKPDSLGYTDEQHQQVAAYWKRLLQLSIKVTTHRFWQTLGPGLVVEGRRQLKHVDDQPETTAGAAA
ncbi:hypothetical protein [Streptomyces durocortorensis]|uniref:Uncharacterized protein n=1 Tax=Streptomyces durocortorensis TaxID=2811104 RepID=A0ABS2HQ48_9ACTN|nr:hypothetical protein [Streptomyces durocortorensis]MBM7052825.1 hypothetical protein [Streptomyces durocortorensis]